MQGCFFVGMMLENMVLKLKNSLKNKAEVEYSTIVIDDKLYYNISCPASFF